MTLAAFAPRVAELVQSFEGQCKVPKATHDFCYDLSVFTNDMVGVLCEVASAGSQNTPTIPYNKDKSARPPGDYSSDSGVTGSAVEPVGDDAEVKR